jgi:hypothetical protein
LSRKIVGVMVEGAGTAPPRLRRVSLTFRERGQKKSNETNTQIQKQTNKRTNKETNKQTHKQTNDESHEASGLGPNVRLRFRV